MYPLFLDLTGRRVVVVGGGRVATRRIGALLEAGADVHVVAPGVTDALAGLAETGAVSLVRRGYLPGDLEGALLVHTATGVKGVDAQVSWDAAAAGIWCVNAADHARSAAWTPTVARGTGAAEGIEVAVSAGGDPRRAVRVRDAIADLLAAGGLPTARFRAAR